MRFSFSMGQDSNSPKIAPEIPCRIAVMGDFSGKGRQTRDFRKGEAGVPKVWSIDHDNFYQIMEQLHVSIEICLEGDSKHKITLDFANLDDFHPDKIFRNLLIFHELRQLRKNLQNSDTFEIAAQEVRNWATLESTPEKQATGDENAEDSSQETKTITDQGTLDDLLTKPLRSQKDSPLENSTINLTSLLQSIVTPYVVRAPDPSQPQLVAMLDEIISDQMRKILHNPKFQELEASWRGIHFLLSRLELDENLKLYVIDVSKNELRENLNASPKIQKCPIYKLLVENEGQTQGSAPFSVLVGCYYFDGSSKDVNLLTKMAKLSKDAEAPFLASIDSNFIGCSSIGATPDSDHWLLPAIEDKSAWNRLQLSENASYLGLVFPRVLLRIPYGENSDPIENFEFEEFLEKSSIFNFLWGNAAFLCAYVLADFFTHQGWNFRVSDPFEIENLPVHYYKLEGESKMTPCAEALLTDRTVEVIRSMGIIPMQSIKNRDALLLGGINSISPKGELLKGRWKPC